ncbi:MAG TPA: endonuclease/exonuclease/phosphatase family protein, partial [Solirubrobacterales bacterium]|nr:endonuclease/exonuclease/phosphatase family protein [Solirubrobacterales bacterium]
MSAHPDRLRVISTNLANGRAAPSAIERLVDALDPDVFAVQELSAAQARVLERRFPHGKLDPAHDSMGMGIALRHPGTVWRLPLSYRDACVAELPSPTGVGRDTEIVNVHIAAPHIQPLWRTLARRRQQLRALEAHLEASRRPAHLAAAREAP